MSTASYRPRRECRERTRRVRGLNYHVGEWGAGDSPLLVFLHGWGDTGATFQFVVDAFERDWFTVAPDWRGFGKTEWPAGGYWFPDYLADLDELLRFYSPHEPVALIGHSMGANVAALYAGTFPERVSSLVNIEGFGLPDSRAEEAPLRYRQWIEAGREVTAASHYRDIDDLATRLRRRHPAMTATRAAYVAEQWTVPAAGGGLQLRTDPRHRLPNPVLYRREEARACWARIEARVLAVCGARSEFAAAAEAWRAGIAASRQVPQTATIAATGHMIHFEQPGPLAAVIETFLDRGQADL